MTPALLRRTRLLLNTAVVALLLPANARAQTASQQSAPTTLPSETPAHLKVATATWDYERREVMIPMRDGVRLHTVIRSEEHTSELQSLTNLVCRLLLEKKKKQT